MQANTKDWIQYSTAIAMITSAIILAFVSFIVASTVTAGVLWYVSEALVYAGSIFGVSIYFRTKFGDFESRANKFMQKEIHDMADRLEHRLENELQQNNEN